MSYPLPSQVLSGVVFGAANELVGTLSPVAAAATMVRTSQMRTTVSQRASRGVSISDSGGSRLNRKTNKAVSVIERIAKINVFTQPDAVTVRTNFEAVL